MPSKYQAIGKWAWNNRKAIYSASRKMYSGYKRRRAYSKGRAAKRQRFGRTNIGHVIGTSSTKRNESIARNSVNMASKTLYLVGSGTGGLVQLDKQAGGDSLNRRERDICNLRGLRICAEVYCIATTPCYYNFALVYDRENLKQPLDQDFWRAQGGDDRSINFNIDPGPPIVYRDSLHYHCAPLNTDRFVVLMHKRYLINGSQNVNGPKSYFARKWYVKIKRQLRFDGAAASTPVDGQIYGLQWCDDFASAGGPSTSVADRVNATHTVTCYFKDPCC